MENHLIARNTTELEQLEGVIERGLSTFYEVGRALMRIRDEQLYEKVRGFATFESYCKERWGFERRRAYQFIDAAMVSDNVKNFTQYQIKESHTIPLAKLNNNPEAQRTAWQKAVETAPEGKRLISSLLWAWLIPGRILTANILTLMFVKRIFILQYAVAFTLLITSRIH